jgi:hypothetical protein
MLVAKDKETAMNISHFHQLLAQPLSTVILAGLIFYPALAQATDTGLADTWMMAKGKSETVQIPENQVERVRIPLTLVSYNSLVSKSADGSKAIAKIPTKPVHHILRARLEKQNDFYVGSLRVLSTPIRWVKSSQTYQAKFEIYKRLGEGGTVEEPVGTMYLQGKLQKQSDGLYSIAGSSRRKFTDANGQPTLEIALGHPIQGSTNPMAVSRTDSPIVDYTTEK